MSLNSVRKAIKEAGNPTKAKLMQGFFKTGVGQYGEGDIFMGLTNPQCRTIAKKYSGTTYNELEEMLKSKIHEERFIALAMLVDRYRREKSTVYQFYVDNLQGVNNWDLVDCSAYHIMGDYLKNKQDEERNILRQLALSSNLWRRRVAIMSTFAFIRNDDFKCTMQLSEKLLDDDQDLIHKAVGWMLREVGKRDQPLLENFLQTHYDRIPRTCLRYAIEKFEEDKRKGYLKKQF